MGFNGLEGIDANILSAGYVLCGNKTQALMIEPSG